MELSSLGPTAASLAVAIALSLTTVTAEAQTTRCKRFTELRAVLEQNLTDGDAEVVLFAKGQDEGMRALKVNGPNGRELSYSTGNAIGTREFLFESAEPPNLAAVLAAFPQGSYSFTGNTVSGGCLFGRVNLSHVSALGTTLLAPAEDAVVPAGPVTLRWTAVPGVARYRVELTNESTDAEYVFDVAPSITRIVIPANLMEADTEYGFAVASVASNGNIAAVEQAFTTAP